MKYGRTRMTGRRKVTSKKERGRDKREMQRTVNTKEESEKRAGHNVGVKCNTK